VSVDASTATIAENVLIIAYWLVAWALAFAVLRSARSSTNVSLAIMLFVFGIPGRRVVFWLVSAYAQDPRLTFNYALLDDAISLASPVLYALFFTSAIDLPALRSFRTRAVRAGLMVAAVTTFAWPFLDPSAFRGPDFIISGGIMYWLPSPGNGSIGIPTNVGASLIYATGTTAALAALSRTSSGAIRRKQAVVYLQAFVFQDAALILFGTRLYVFSEGSIPDHVCILAAQSALVISVILLARGLLKYQLFDFDLKLKWTLKRGTLVAIILGAFFLATALAEQYLQQFGWVIGGLAVGALLFALRPIERAIDRMADRAMPRTTGTPEYLTQRKHEIYRAALEEASRDGVVSTKERRLLLRLASDLGISADDANGIERDVLEAAA
jgi:hypothetical protein